MATLEELQSTLIKAHNAGDVESATALTRAIDQMTGVQPQQVPAVQPGEVQEPVIAEPEQPEGFVGKVKEAFTGEARTTPELEALSDISDLPELNEISVAGLKSAFSTLTADPMEAAKALKVNFPDIEIRQDAKGNPIIKSAISGEEFAVNKPGLDIRDVGRGAFITSLFANPLTRRALGRGGLIRAAATGAGVQAGIETAQQLTGGEFDPEQVALAGATETLGPITRGAVGAIRQGTGAIRRALARTPVPPSAAQRTVRQAEKLGVPVLTSDVRPPETFAGKFAQAVQERIPFIGTGPIRSKQKEARANAVRNILRDMGADESVKASDEVMDDLLKKRSKDLTKYSNSKKEVIERLSDVEQTMPIDKTVQSIDDEIVKLQNLKTANVKPLINLLTDFKESVANQSLDNIEILRQQLGNELSSPDLTNVRDLGEKTARKIYKSLNEDMGNFIKATGERRDFNKWQVANKRLRNLIGDLDTSVFKSTIKKGSSTPEEVKRLLFSKKPSEIKKLYKGLTPDGKKRAKVAAVQEIVERAGGIDDITPAKFLRQAKQLEKTTGIFFNETEKKQFKGLMKVLDITQRGDIAGVKPPTGAEATTVLAPAILTQLLGGVVPGVGATLGIGGLARVYESKPFRNLLLQLAADKKIPPAQEREIVNKLVSIIQTARQISEPKEEN